ncbi:MAG: DUF4440 domain-containing protein [Nocardioidaceae bacterium]|nr:DUF4440 domain-containing protein [Nocardioidaceae bacterium]
MTDGDEGSVSDRPEIDTEVEAVVDRFFTAFTDGAEHTEAILTEVLLPEAVIVSAAGGLTVYDVRAFTEPRVALLRSGTLAGFREWRTEGRTGLFGDVAQHWRSYAKAWTQDGVERHGAGTKSLQLVRTSAGWRISAVLWDDERA